MNSLPSVVAVVLNYRRPQETIACVETLRQSSTMIDVVVVVDNDSGDESAGLLRRALPSVEVLDSGQNRGYAGGMNVGLRRALATGATYIFALNSDVLVEPGTIEDLVNAMERDPAAGAATGTFFYHPERSKVWFAGGSIAFWRANGVTRRTVPVDGAGEPADAQQVSFLTGCGLLFRASSLRTAGLFDERYFMYQEDVELSVRLVAHGFRLLYVPRAALHHRMTVDVQTPLKVYYTTRNRLLLLENAPTWWHRACGTAHLGIMLAIKIVWWSLLRKPFVRPACRGVTDYFSGRLYEGRGLEATVPQRTP